MKTVAMLLSEQIATEQDYIREHNAIGEILKALEGKEINGRTFSKKRLGGFRFSSEFGMFNIIGKYRHLIGYASSPFVDCAEFEDFDACYGKAAAHRIKQCQEIDKEKLENLLSTLSTGVGMIQNALKEAEKDNLTSYYNPIYYQILEEAKQGLSKIDFNAFVYKK